MVFNVQAGRGFDQDFQDLRIFRISECFFNRKGAEAQSSTFYYRAGFYASIMCRAVLLYCCIVLCSYTRFKRCSGASAKKSRTSGGAFGSLFQLRFPDAAESPAGRMAMLLGDIGWDTPMFAK